MQINFPIFVLARDSGEMYRCDTLYQMQSRFERIDIENGEYEAWDRDGLPLDLKVQKPVWLMIESRRELHPEQFREVLRKYAAASGANIDIGDRTDFGRVFDQISNHIGNQKTAKGFLHRIFKRPNG